MVSEVIRYQTPIIAFRRTALEDTELNGKIIRKGQKAVMWYISGNRDANVIENPDAFIIGRPNLASTSLSDSAFIVVSATGWRNCSSRFLGSKILNRSLKIEVMGPPKRVFSVFVHGISELPVRIAA